MGLDNYIQTTMRSILRNPILEVLTEIKITKILITPPPNNLKNQQAYLTLGC